MFEWRSSDIHDRSKKNFCLKIWLNELYGKLVKWSFALDGNLKSNFRNGYCFLMFDYILNNNNNNFN